MLWPGRLPQRRVHRLGERGRQYYNWLRARSTRNLGCCVLLCAGYWKWIASGLTAVPTFGAVTKPKPLFSCAVIV
jgi:hypothetical protein